MKVQDLAKELEMNNKELIEKINSMGIEVKSYNSNISDNDVTIVRNAILNGGKSGETKIVKVAPKKSETQDNEPKVEVKRANIKMPTAPLPKAKPAAQTAAPAQKAPMPMGKPVAYNETKAKAPLPMGKPVAYNETKAKAPLPMGKPVAYKSAEERAAEDAAKSGTAPAAVEAPATPAPAPKQEETPVAAPAAPAPAPAPKQEEAPAAAPAAVAPEVKKEEPKPAPAPEVKKEEPKPVPAPAPKEEKKPEQKPERRQDNRPNDRPRRDGDRPQRDNRQQGDRPRRDGDRPQRDNDRPRRDGDRPQRDNRDNRDNRGFQGRQGGNDKPDMGLAGSRQSAKHDDHSHGKDRDQKKEQYRDSRVNDGKRGARPGDERSLEKAKKGKHVKKEKPVVEEPKINMEELPTGTVVINVPITVGGFCEQTKCSLNTVIMSLMKMGIMANINQNLDEDTAQILADEIGISIAIDKVVEETVEEGIEHFEDKESDLKPRPPIVTVMGHVDHGKTSLLDAIRKTNVTAGESGGITQHIGASEVSINGQKIVFLDTPGHEAFTAMRARGAHVTDIAVLVVAADDGVMPQTIESISHAKAAGVPIIVAINKIDKPAANPDRVKQELTEHGILVEDWGGDTISVPVSAKSGEGITNLLEMILLQAEVLELKANPNRLALGTVIEARLDKSKGPVASLLVMNGTLKAGMSIVAGTCSGRIRAMTNYKGDTIAKAGPATAVEILGLTEVPEAGDEFNAVKEDRIAREIAERRKTKLREEVLARNASTTLEQLFSQIQEGEVKELNLIIKGDVQGSVGAIEASLEKLKNENVRVKIIHTGVGTVNESDVMLASTSGAVIIGFNVRPSASVQAMADRENIEIRTYSVIYNIIDDVEAAMKGMLDPEFKEVVLGQVEIRNTFKVPGVGIVGGAYVTDGKVVRNAQVRLVRDGIVIHEGKISSLKRFKDDAKEVQQGFECGIGLENYNDIKEGDVIECFELQEVERK